MSRQSIKQPTFGQRVINKLGPGLSMFLATLLALPVNAGITLPDDPLTTGSRVPANLMFILDNSLSMTSSPGTEMSNPDLSQVCRRSSDGATSCQSNPSIDITNQAYTSNTIYYNPTGTTLYQPWLNAAGNPLTGGTSYTSAYSDPALTSGSINLGNAIQTFYVPKNTANTNQGYLANTTNYYRYQILNGNRVVRSELLNAPPSGVIGTQTQTYDTRNNLAASNGYWVRFGTGSNSNAATAPNNSYVTINLNDLGLPNGSSLTNVVFSLSGGTGNANLYVRRSNPPGTANGNYDCRPDQASNNNEVCTQTTNLTGTWNAAVRANGNNISNVTLTIRYTYSTNSDAALGCASSTNGIDWRNCTETTPTGRTVAAELQNYATWYSYHRTRMKAAKAGASSAFSELGADVRVGFRVINPSTSGANANFDIPVNNNNGVFTDIAGASNRTAWYNKLHGATAPSDGYTPLRSALRNTGQYFERTDASGPYGPQSGADQLACRQNFAILTTDGYWNQDSGGNFNIGTGIQNNADGIAGPNGYVVEAPYRDGANVNYSTTLADVAMHYWKTDLRGNLTNIVPTSSNDSAFWQHMVTFGISLGARGTINPNGPYPGQPGGLQNWPDPQMNLSASTTTEVPARIDDLLHAAVNSRGKFIAAANPGEFSDGLSTALAAIAESTGSFANVSANSATLSAGAQLFRAKYVSGIWTGELEAFPRATTGGGFTNTASWSASAGIPTTGRKVFTSAGAFPTSATAAQLAALERTGASNYPVTGAQNAAYLAGARTLEIRNGGNLRNRNHLLGDIVGSSPTFVSETNTLYVGANDGMLHAINAANGSEVFAFIPNGINWSNLGSLSRPDYGHRYFVDGPTVVSTRSQTPGASILVSALGKGGKGLFALDVTNPAGFTASNVKWQITADDDPLTTADNNIGLIQGKPIIARLNNGQMALIVPNGVNSTSGHAALLIYNLDTGALIREIDTGVGSPLTDNANSNGLSAPVGWNPDGNSTLDYVYAGDMLGNVWKFDLSGASSASWGVANAGSPLFTAVGPDGTTRQPITAGLTVGRHPTTYKTWVFFGTGRFLTVGDVTNTAVQSLYGVMDEGITVAKSALTSRKVLVEGTSSNGMPVRSFEANGSLPAASKGWYINLVDPPTPPGTAVGERVVTAPQMDGSVLEVSTIIPTNDACQSDGRGYLNALDAFTGTSASKPYFDVNGDGDFSNDTLTAPSSDDEVPIGSVDIGVGMVSQGALFSNPPNGPGLICASGSSGESGCVGKNEVRNVGRVSWREVIRN